MNTDDPSFRQLREILEGIWDGRVDSDGEVAPTLQALRECLTATFGDGSPEARLSSSRAGRKVSRACQRLRKELAPAFDPETEMHRIAIPIAKFVIELHRARPFPPNNARAALTIFAVHQCCKFAGCAPPAGIEDQAWEQAMLRGTDETIPKAQRHIALANILIARINQANAESED